MGFALFFVLDVLLDVWWWQLLEFLPDDLWWWLWDLSGP